jgi:hypothetical protein
VETSEPDEASASVESEDTTEGASSDSDDNVNPNREPPTSMTFLEIRHHPHSGIPEPEFIFRDLPSENIASDKFPYHTHELPKGKPWTPFRTRADFEFAETAIQSAMHSKTIKRLLKGIQQQWTEPGQSRITFKGMKDFKHCLAAARTFVVPVSTGRNAYGTEMTYELVSGGYS